MGDATIVDMNEAKAGFDAARADEIAAQTRLDTSYAVLQNIVGRPVTRISGWRADVRLPPVDHPMWTRGSARPTHRVTTCAEK